MDEDLVTSIRSPADHPDALDAFTEVIQAGRRTQAQTVSGGRKGGRFGAVWSFFFVLGIPRVWELLSTRGHFLHDNHLPSKRYPERKVACEHATR